MTDAPTSAEEADALREEEEREEQAYALAVHGASVKPGPLQPFVKHTAKIMREWVRSALLPDVVRRMYNIGMGVQTFDTPTEAGNIVRIEAPPAVQQRALQSLMIMGVPTQLGITDDNGETLPGVIALGAIDLDAAQQAAHGERYSPLVTNLQAGLEAVADLAASATIGRTGPVGVTPLKPMAERIKNGEFQVVETDDGVGPIASLDDEPPGPIADVETPEKMALRRHRERMKKPVGG